MHSENSSSSSKHHPCGGATAHCNNNAIERAISDYQAHHDLASLTAIVSLTQDRAEALIRFRRTSRIIPECELLSDVHCKLLRSIDKFDPSKGTAFSFVSQVVLNALCTSVTNARRYQNRYRELDGEVNNLPAAVHDDAGVADLTHRIRAEVKTTLKDQRERDIQRWYVTSFCDQSFAQCRHQCADAAMAVHSLSHERSREIYDLSILEVAASCTTTSRDANRRSLRVIYSVPALRG